MDTTKLVVIIAVIVVLGGVGWFAFYGNRVEDTKIVGEENKEIVVDNTQTEGGLVTEEKAGY